jgi:hypothetical protein
MTAELEKVERKTAKVAHNSKQKEARKWEAKGKSTMTKWLTSSISNRDDRKENPDRDKRRKLNCVKAEAWLHRADRSGPSGDLETKPAGPRRGHDPQEVTPRTEVSKSL